MCEAARVDVTFVTNRPSLSAGAGKAEDGDDVSAKSLQLNSG